MKGTKWWVVLHGTIVISRHRDVIAARKFIRHDVTTRRLYVLPIALNASGLPIFAPETQERVTIEGGFVYPRV